MKYLILFLTPLVLAIMALCMPVSAAAPTLASYSDFARTVACDNFVTNTVYIKADGFNKNKEYRVIFWDGSGDNVRQQDLTGATINANKTLQHLFVLPDEPGTWYCIAYNSGYQPACYYPSDPNIVAECSFTVQEGAVPEIPDVIAGIVVAGLCGLIYRKMRRRLKCK